MRQGSNNVSLATATGILLAIVVFGLFAAGPLALTVLILVALGFAAAEAFAGFRTVGRTSGHDSWHRRRLNAGRRGL